MRMQKLPQKEIEQEAKRVKEEYAYMDKMPLEGWMWEFMRRSPDTRQFLDKFKKLSLQETISKTEIDNLFVEYEKIPLWCLIKLKELRGNGEYSFNADQSIIVACKNTNKRPDIFYVLPDYQIPYNDFTYAGSHPVKIGGIYPYEIFNNSDWYIYAKSRLRKGFREKFDICLQKLPMDMRMDTLEGLEQNIFVRISKKATDRDLKKLIQEIKPYLPKKKRRMRDKKWKYYLIVYDMREQHDYTYNDIADILNSAFPKKTGQVYDDVNIQYHYNQAVQLIDKGAYKEYLHYR